MLLFWIDRNAKKVIGAAIIVLSILMLFRNSKSVCYLPMTWCVWKCNTLTMHPYLHLQVHPASAVTTAAAMEVKKQKEWLMSNISSSLSSFMAVSGMCWSSTRMMSRIFDWDHDYGWLRFLLFWFIHCWRNWLLTYDLLIADWLATGDWLSGRPTCC